MNGAAEKTALIGFGEAGQAFAAGWRAHVHDIKTDSAETRAAKRADYERAGVHGHDSLAGALEGASLILSLVTADQAGIAAANAARHIVPHAIYCDMNSAAPDTKRANAEAISAAGGDYVDVAIMAPAHPARLAVPLLLSGPKAGDVAAWLAALGFTNARIVGGDVGRASAIKMIRSVMVKGLEALSAECFLAAIRAGVADEVRASLDASWPGFDWAAKADYDLERMLVHGLRRAAEMEEVARTIEGLGLDAHMSRAAVKRQREMGALEIAAPPPGLAAKADAITRTRNAKARAA